MSGDRTLVRDISIGQTSTLLCCASSTQMHFSSVEVGCRGGYDIGCIEAGLSIAHGARHVQVNRDRSSGWVRCDCMERTTIIPRCQNMLKHHGNIMVLILNRREIPIPTHPVAVDLEQDMIRRRIPSCLGK